MVGSGSLAQMFRLRRNPYIYLSGAFGAAWVLGAWSQPENSYLMFPALVAAAVPLSYRLIAAGPLPKGLAIGAAIAGILNVFLLAAMLAIAGKLAGPNLLPAGSNVLDSVVLAAGGSAAGGWLAMADFGRSSRGS